MGVSFGIAADSAQECAEALALLGLLRQHGVEVTVTLRPAQVGGTRWVARAVPTPQAPAGGEGLSVER
ncbi:hypothetical protein ACWGDE_01690 [Streptomyces sp. NPDC054956]